MAHAVTITVSLDSHVYHTLQDYAASTGRTESSAAAAIIARYLDVYPQQQLLPPRQEDTEQKQQQQQEKQQHKDEQQQQEPKQQEPKQQQQQGKAPSAFAQQAQRAQRVSFTEPSEEAPGQQQQQPRALSTEWSLARVDSRGVSALRQQQSLVPLYVAAPIIRLVDGLLAGDHSIADCLEKGNFGIGTLNYLDGEVVIYDGVAYHQSAHGTKVLLGDERTPFMTVTTFNKAWCREFTLPPMSDLATLEAHMKSLFRSKNVIYAILVKGSFPKIKCRSVSKQEGNVRLAQVAASQVMFDYADESSGHLVGFFMPEFVGSSLNVPGFHFHFLSADKERGGHLLALELSKGKVLLQEIHRTQVDLPFEADWMATDFNMGKLDEDLHAAERDRQ